MKSILNHLRVVDTEVDSWDIVSVIRQYYQKANVTDCCGGKTTNYSSFTPSYKFWKTFQNTYGLILDCTCLTATNYELE